MKKNYPDVFEKISGDDRFSLVYEIMIADQYKAKRFLTKDSIAIDAGANIGIFSIFASLFSPQGKIFAFEPVKNTYEILRKNSEYYPQIKIFNKGLGAKEKTKRFSPYPVAPE